MIYQHAGSERDKQLAERLSRRATGDSPLAEAMRGVLDALGPSPRRTRRSCRPRPEPRV
jgi:hypothetical protein